MAVKSPHGVGRRTDDWRSTSRSVRRRYSIRSETEHELDAVRRAELDEVGHARHRPVGLHDLADHAGRAHAGEPGEVDRGLGLAGALEHAAGARAQREDVARA